MGGVCASLCSRAFELGFGSPASQPAGRELLVWIPQRPDAQPGTSDPVRHSRLDSGEPDTTQERRNPAVPPGPTRPFTSALVIALSCQPWEAWSLRSFSSFSPDILPPILLSRTSTTLY